MKHLIFRKLRAILNEFYLNFANKRPLKANWLGIVAMFSLVISITFWKRYVYNRCITFWLSRGWSILLIGQWNSYRHCLFWVWNFVIIKNIFLLWSFTIIYFSWTGFLWSVDSFCINIVNCNFLLWWKVDGIWCCCIFFLVSLLYWLFTFQDVSNCYCLRQI